jgi:hypothetical protein
LSSIPPPSEPDRQISRIRLSSWWFTSMWVDMPFEGSGQDPIPANGTENLRKWSPVALMPKLSTCISRAASSCRGFSPRLSPTCLALGHSPRSIFCQSRVYASTSLPSLCSSPITDLLRYYGRSDSCPPGFSALPCGYQLLLRTGLPASRT